MDAYLIKPVVELRRSSMPVFTCLMAYPVERKIPKPLEVVALVALSAGIMTCVWQNDAAGTTLGDSSVSAGH